MRNTEKTRERIAEINAHLKGVFGGLTPITDWDLNCLLRERENLYNDLFFLEEPEDEDPPWEMPLWQRIAPRT